MRRAAAAATPALLLAVGLLRTAAAVGPRVLTSSGLVEGNELPGPDMYGAGVNEFLGIRTGMPTKRYEPPEDFSGPYASSPFMATDFGDACLQVGNSADDVYGSEDCLMANVWQPQNATPGANLPVIVFIYGGSNQFGEAEPYNGSALAHRQGVVYVSIAYRTGPLGWMAFEEDQAAGLSTGNLALLDTQSGLRWVQREVAAFGGDPSKVIIHGQSSGASLVEMHLVMPGSKGLLRGLASESGGLSASPLAAGIEASKAIGEALGCQGSLKKCLQQAHPVDLTSTTYSYGWGPHVDGVTVPADPMLMLSQGSINPVSVIMGSQTNDTFRELVKNFLKEDGTIRPLAPLAYEAMVAQQVGPRHALDALKLYPANHEDPTQNVHLLASVSSDKMLCDVRRRVDLVNRVHPGSAFMYRFNWWYKSNPKCTAEPNYHEDYMGSVHEDEVTFVMGQPIFMFDGACCGKWGDKLTREPCDQMDKCVACWDPALGDGYHAYFNEQEWRFSALVSGYWAKFAAAGTPNGEPSTGHWPTFGAGEPVTHNIVLDADLPDQHKQELTPHDNPSICAFWDSVTAQEKRSPSSNLIVEI